MGDIYDIWDSKAKEITLMDNNILALPEHFEKISQQIMKENLTVDFNQGLDIRLLNERQMKLLVEMKTKTVRFAWDDMCDLGDKFRWARGQLGECCVYIIAGLIPFEKVFEKVEFLRNIRHVPYIMRHESCAKEPQYIALARWVNQRHLFKAMTYIEFLETCYPNQPQYWPQMLKKH